MAQANVVIIERAEGVMLDDMLPPESAFALPSDESIWDAPSDLTLNADRSSASGDSRSFYTSKRRASDASVFSEAIHASAVHPPSGLSPVLSSFIVINYISAGYILLPWAFAQGGTLLSCIVLIITSIQSNVTATFILEAAARAETLRHVQQSRHGRPETLPHSYSMEIRLHVYELSELCLIFFRGNLKFLQTFFTTTTAFDLCGITWAYAAIFGATMADNLPIGQDCDYQIYLLIFAIVVVPLACIPIIDQCWIQFCFLLARTIMVLLMICTVAVGYASDTPQFANQVGPIKEIPLANFPNLMVLIQVCVFSTAFQFAVPGMSGVSRNKQVMLEIFGSAVSYILISNMILGLLLAIYFGSQDIAKSSNLNWLEYHGGTWDGTGRVQDGRAGWASFICNYIVVFAALDGLAIYPLIAVSLGDILLGAYYGEKAQEHHHDWKRRSFFRIISSVPQLIGAMFVRDLGVM